MLLSFALASCGGGGGDTTPATGAHVSTFSTYTGDSFGLAFDSGNNLYVVNPTLNAVVKITPAGTFSSWASGSPFNAPIGIVFDASDNAYISNSTGNNIIRRTTVPVVAVYAGTGAAGHDNNTNPVLSTFNIPYGLARYQSLIYVADSVNNAIRKIDLASSGAVSDFLTTSPFTVTNGVAVDGSGNVYLSSGTSNVIMQYSSGGAATRTTTLPANPLLPQIYGIAANSAGDIFAVDYINHIVWKITAAGTASVIAGNPGISGPATNGSALAVTFHNPRGIALDSAGNVYVADDGNQVIRKITF